MVCYVFLFVFRLEKRERSREIKIVKQQTTTGKLLGLVTRYVRTGIGWKVKQNKQNSYIMTLGEQAHQVPVLYLHHSLVHQQEFDS